MRRVSRKQAKPRVQVALRLDPHLYERLKEEADRRGMSINALVEHTLRQGLVREREGNKEE